MGDDMKLRWAILMGLNNSLAVAVLFGSYNPGTPPPQGDWLAVIGWPTGNVITLFLLLAAIWSCCLLCVSWKDSRVPWWQRLIITSMVAVTCGSAYWAFGVWRMR